MNLKIAMIAAAVAAASASFANVIYSQAPVAGGEGGPFSDPAQTIADNFTVDSSTFYNHVAFWGSFFFQRDPLKVGDQRTFTIRRYSTAAAANLPFSVLSESLVNATVTAKTTVNDLGDTVYRFDTDIAVNNITGGVQYFLNVENPGPNGTFRWHIASGPDNISAVSTDGGASWRTVGAPRENMAFELSQVVPEPATWLAMGLGAAILVKRRRR